MITKLKLLVVVILLSLLSQGTAKGQSVQMPELAKELRTMREIDQKLRKKWAKIASSGNTDSKKFKLLTNKVVATDSSNTERLKVVIDKYGWPTYDLVGKRASGSAWIIAQHADRDPLFQIKCLPLLKKAVDNGQSDPVQYAFLYDRVQVAKGEKQLYATQSTTNNGIKKGEFHPIEDEANVQNRRAEMGFDLHIETYAGNLGFEYKVLTKGEAERKAEAFADSYKQNVAKARQAMIEKDYSKAVENYVEALKSYGNVETEDFVETARAHALAKHEDSPWVASYLIIATIRGYKNTTDFFENSDFDYLEKASKRNWNNLKRIVQNSRQTTD